jgi:ATP-dependent helicase/nuclease subunit A
LTAVDTIAAERARRQRGAEQRTASEPGRSAFVAASAGTGKTHVLTNRVLRLMLDGTPPRRILCLTFTKAAAAEMANRINHRLGEWAALTDSELRSALEELTGRRAEAEALGTARALFARVLDEPGGLRIKTIHSFCESLLARFPLEARVAPHAQVIDERTAAELLDQAREEVLSRALREPDSALARALGTVTAQVGDRRFTELIAELVQERRRFLRLSDRYPGIEALVAATYRRFGVGPEDTAESVLAAASAAGRFDGPGLKGAAEAMLQGSAVDKKHGAVIIGWLDDPAGRVDGFRDYLSVFFTKDGWGGGRKQLAHAQTLKILGDAGAILAAEAERLERVRERLKAVTVAGASAALVRLGHALLETYEAIKRRRAVLDYDDLILIARDLLNERGAAAWVLYKLDGGIDHILIDEAQDTSPEQWQVIAALAEEFFAGAGAREELRTIFAVGDEKQSIFSFQGAEPAAFEDMRRHFERRVRAAAQDFENVELHLSYRSTPAVLRAVDQTFARTEASDGLTAEARPISHRAHREGHAGVVELWPTARPREAADRGEWELPLHPHEAGSARAQLAERIADQIDRWLKDGEVLEARGRPIRPGDIMVLVRRRDAFVDELLRRLKQRRVPVAGADRMVLTEQLAVMDLMALARFVLLPEDDLSLAEVLKSPLIGFDDDTLFTVAHGRGHKTLWQALKERCGQAPALRAAYDELSGLLAKADFMPPYEFFAEVLVVRRGRQRLLERLGLEANDPLDEFLNLALAYDRVHAPSLQGFIDWLEAGQAEVKRDMEQGQDQVRVMTVHGAKGLEAPIVILPDTCRVPATDPRLFWLEDGDEPAFLWPPRVALDEDVCRAAREAARRRREQEHRRLLYVAMTRAEDRLYVAGWEGRNGRADGCWYDHIHQALSGMDGVATLADGELRVDDRQTAEPQERRPGDSAVEPGGPLPAWALSPPKPEPSPPRRLAPSRPEDAEPAVRSPLGEDDGARFRRGLLIHRLLQSLPELPERRRAAACRRYLERRAPDLNAEARREIAAQTLAVLRDPAFAPLFGPGSRAEVPLAGRVGDEVISGQVDRLAITDDAVLVVDYKSSRAPPEREAGVPTVYLRQMAAYRAILREIYPDRPVRCALLWTDGPRLMPLGDRLMDRYAP